MDVKELGKLKENVEEALRKIIAKGENISAAELENAQKALCVIDFINMMEQDEKGEYSGRSYGMRSHGMYPREHYNGESYRGMRRSYNEGYSGHDLRGRMLDVMERMRDEAHNDHERQMMNDWIQRVASTN